MVDILFAYLQYWRGWAVDNINNFSPNLKKKLLKMYVYLYGEKNLKSF